MVAIKGGDGVIIFGGHGRGNSLKDAFMLDTISNTLQLIKEDIGEGIYPGYYPAVNVND